MHNGTLHTTTKGKPWERTTKGNGYKWSERQKALMERKRALRPHLSRAVLLLAHVVHLLLAHVVHLLPVYVVHLLLVYVVHLLLACVVTESTANKQENMDLRGLFIGLCRLVNQCG